MKSRIFCLFLTLAFASLAPSMASALTPVLFTTNDGNPPVAYSPYRVQYITVYVDNVKKCYTESHGNCTATPQLTPGLHKVTYVWASCNNPDKCPNYGEETRYINVPDQPGTYYVRIPTVRVRWYTEYGVNVSLNDVWRGVALGGGTLSTNVMGGCYTASYKKGYSQPIPSWPAPLPGVPDETLKGFDRLCFGSNDTYPVPVPAGSDTNPPHVRIQVPDYWP